MNALLITLMWIENWIFKLMDRLEKDFAAENIYIDKNDEVYRRIEFARAMNSAFRRSYDSNPYEFFFIVPVHSPPEENAASSQKCIKGDDLK